MDRPLQIAVIGSSVATGPDSELAEEVGRLLAQWGATVVCGGGEGVMEAVARGAAEAGGDVIGIVREDDAAAANRHITHVVASGIGQARNLSVAASGDAVIAIAGEWGTLSEIALAKTLGRTVIGLQSWQLAERTGADDSLRSVATPAEAVDAALEAASVARGSTP